MKLGDFYTVDADSNGFTLTYEKEGDLNPDTGKLVLTRKVMYYPNLEQSLKGYVRHSILMKCSQEDLTLNQVLELIQTLQAIIVETCNELQIKKDLFTKVTAVQLTQPL